MTRLLYERTSAKSDLSSFLRQPPTSVSQSEKPSEDVMARYPQQRDSEAFAVEESRLESPLPNNNIERKLSLRQLKRNEPVMATLEKVDFLMRKTHIPEVMDEEEERMMIMQRQGGQRRLKVSARDAGVPMNITTAVDNEDNTVASEVTMWTNAPTLSTDPVLVDTPKPDSHEEELEPETMDIEVLPFLTEEKEVINNTQALKQQKSDSAMTADTAAESATCNSTTANHQSAENVQAANPLIADCEDDPLISSSFANIVEMLEEYNQRRQDAEGVTERMEARAEQKQRTKKHTENHQRTKRSPATNGKMSSPKPDMKKRPSTISHNTSGSSSSGKRTSHSRRTTETSTTVQAAPSKPTRHRTNPQQRQQHLPTGSKPAQPRIFGSSPIAVGPTVLNKDTQSLRGEMVVMVEQDGIHSYFDV